MQNENKPLSRNLFQRFANKYTFVGLLFVIWIALFDKYSFIDRFQLYTKINQLESEREGKEVKKAYAHQIDRNCLPHCDSFTDNGYTKEEMKLVNETCKILGDDTIKVTATAVRVPVMGGHSESVNIEFKQDYDLNALRELLAHSEGIIVQDDPAQNLYPMAITANEKDEVFVGRLRRDFSQPNSLNLWVVSDNLRKGAATNAVQIAEYLNTHNLL